MRPSSMAESEDTAQFCRHLAARPPRGRGASSRIDLSLQLRTFHRSHNLVRAASMISCNGQRDRLKVLVWDGSGLWVCAKRLEKGRFTWPQSGDVQGKVILSHEELSLLLGGIDLAKTKHKRWCRKASPEGHAAA
jgi:transposase